MKLIGYPATVITLRQKVEFIVKRMVTADEKDWPPTSLRTGQPIAIQADLGRFLYVSERVRDARAVPYGDALGVMITRDPPMSVFWSLERYRLDIVVYHPWQSPTGHIFAGGKRIARLSDEDFV